jgi:hypothetical protein
MISSSRSRPPRTSTPTSPQRSRCSKHISTIRSLIRLGPRTPDSRLGRIEFLYPTGLGKPETFAFLGFTHICGKTSNGRFQLKRITEAKRLRAKLREIRPS